jgi:transposase InsO family protein
MVTSIHERYLKTTEPGGFSGLSTFILSNKKLPFKRKLVQAELKKLKSYRLHAPAYKRFPRRRVYVSRMYEQWMMDLIDIQSHSRFNYRQKFLLVVIDGFSKQAWIEAIPNKKGQTVAAALEKIFKRSGQTPNKIQSDRGTEFYNIHMKKLLQRYKVQLFSVHSDLKSCVIERFNRTLFGKIARYLTFVGGRKFVHKLPEIEHLYNHSYHRSIKMQPSQVNLKNSRQVYENLYGKVKPTLYRPPKFQVDDLCLIARRKKIFEKGYAQTYFDEVFRVKRIRHTTPVVFELVDLNNVKINGTFYEKDLLKL